jgi:3-dehydroquinate dehydratase
MVRRDLSSNGRNLNRLDPCEPEVQDSLSLGEHQVIARPGAAGRFGRDKDGRATRKFLDVQEIRDRRVEAMRSVGAARQTFLALLDAARCLSEPLIEVHL